MTNHVPKFERPHRRGGVQKIFRFDNGRGASVAKFPGSEGLELAVLKFNGDDQDSYEVDYTTPITDDVLENLSTQTMDEALDKIEALPPV